MIGTKINNRYKIEKELGSGGFGTVFLASYKHIFRTRHCAIKQLSVDTIAPNKFKKAQARFKQEAIILDNLYENFQNRSSDKKQKLRIPKILDYFEWNKKFYLVQEYIPGNNLREEIKLKKQLSENEVIKIVEDILDILIFIHDNNVIHRDIKPSNIIRCDRDNRLFLIDFGLIKIISEFSLDNHSVGVGTDGYRPIEQVQGQPKFASDIYALGMTAIYALTGVSPLKLRVSNNRTREILWREELKEEINPELAGILDKMVVYNWEDRYNSARDVKQDLEKLQVNSTDQTENVAPRRPQKEDSPSGSEISKGDGETKNPKSDKPNNKLVDLIKKIVISKNGLGIIVIGSLLLGTGLVTYCSSQNNKPPLIYENANDGISIQYPPNWKSKRIGGGLDPIVILYPQKYGDRDREDIPILVEIDVKNLTGLNMSLDRFTNERVKSITRSNSFELIDSDRINLSTDWGKKSAHRFVYLMKNSRGKTNKWLQYWFLEKDCVYILTYVAPEKEYDLYIDKVEEVIVPSWNTWKNN